MRCSICLCDPCQTPETCEGWRSAARDYAATRPPPRPRASRQEQPDQGQQPFFDESDDPPAWEPPPNGPHGPRPNGKDHGAPLIQTAAQFVAGFVPPNYLLDGVLQRGCLYSLTARTGHGKTAITMLLMHHVERSKPLLGREVEGGALLFLAGENADAIRARFLAQCDYYQIDPGEVQIYFIGSIVNIADRMDEIRAAAAAIGDLALVVVDTAAAYFPGDDPNNNAQQGAYARGPLRELTQLAGKPVVIANSHPIKNAARDNLLPMGGSQFLNEVDGNLTAWTNNEKQVVLHWQGKFRGPEFEPIAFELETVMSSRVVDAKGRIMPSVIAVPIAEERLKGGEERLEADENRVLFALGDNPKASLSFLAEKCGFVIDGRPQKTRVHRIMSRLREDKLVVQHRGSKYVLTTKGRKEVGIEGNNDD